MNNSLISECGGAVFGVHGFIIEAWGQGFMFGAIIILLSLTVANMRPVLLHKLILTELVITSLHGTFAFVRGPAYGWYMSSTATLLYIAYNLHNVINWIKVKPFLSKWSSRLYIGTVILVLPYWIAEIYLNFAYNNHLGDRYFKKTRPWEAICREPWWIFTSLYLLYVIKRCYGCSVVDLVRTNSRFGVLIAAMALSLVFVILDIVEVATSSICAGTNPYWKLALIFKFTADAVFLDDFKAVLDRLTARTIGNLNCTELNVGDDL